MTTKEMAELIGKQVEVNMEGLAVQCTIDDVRRSYGNIHYQVKPVAGRGSKWVSEERVVLS